MRSYPVSKNGAFNLNESLGVTRQRLSLVTMVRVTGWAAPMGAIVVGVLFIAVAEGKYFSI